jgi:2-dehydro-3-deoxyphosphogluconate aldolase / (4S)-4-hydroxy-2-oxoglutarate aldolase
MTCASGVEAFGPGTMNTREQVVYFTKATGVLPCIKLRHQDDYLAYARAMADGGARVIEVTMTTPGALQAIHDIAAHFGDKLYVAAGTVLDPATAREVILAGGKLIVSPVILSEMVDVAHRYGVACYPGAQTATEVLLAMRAGADVVKVFPAEIGGPKYMTNLRMVFPEANLIPSGGVNADNAAEFIRCGACAVSGARTFMNPEMVARQGLGWITQQVARFIEIVRQARLNLPPLP